MLTDTDVRLQVHIQPRIGDRIKMKARYRRGQIGEVVEVLTPPTENHSITGLARYGVRFSDTNNIHDVLRHEFTRLKK